MCNDATDSRLEVEHSATLPIRLRSSSHNAFLLTMLCIFLTFCSWIQTLSTGCFEASWTWNICGYFQRASRKRMNGNRWYPYQNAQSLLYGTTQCKDYCCFMIQLLLWGSWVSGLRGLANMTHTQTHANTHTHTNTHPHTHSKPAAAPVGCLGSHLMFIFWVALYNSITFSLGFQKPLFLGL